MSKSVSISLLIAALGGLLYVGFSFRGYPDIFGSQIRKDILLVGVLGGESKIEQVIAPEKPYLSAVEVLIDVAPQNYDGIKEIKVYFRLEEESGEVIAYGEDRFDVTGETESLFFSFTPQPNSDIKKYKLSINSDAPPGYVNLWTSQFDAYPNGDVFINETEMPFDFAFNTYYKPNLTSWFSILSGDQVKRFIVLCVLLLVFGCIGCFTLLLFDIRFDLVEWIVYSVVFGFVIPSLFFFVIGLFNLKFDALVSGGLFVLLLVANLVKLKVQRKRRSIIRTQTPSYEVWMFGVMLMLVLVSRTVQISDLFVPNWLDGLVHQEMVQTIKMRQSIDYLTIYPKGFHANLIWISYLFGIELQETILLVGQLLSVASGASLYILARRFIKPPFSLFVLMLFWFWSPYPSFLIFWARYPFLQGLVILPALILFLMTKETNKPREMVLIGFLIFGIGITYYGALMMFLSFIVSYYLLLAYYGKSSFLIRNFKFFFISAFPVILVLLIRMSKALSQNIYGQDSSADWLSDAVTTLEISFRGGGGFIWITAFVGLIFAIVNKKKIIIVFSIWILMQLFLQFIQEDIGLTVSSVSNVIVMMSIPLVIYSAFFFQKISAASLRTKSVLIVILLFSFFGVYISSAPTSRLYVIYTYADHMAFTWIDNNVSKSDLFLINSFYWGDDLSPSDGGGWINTLLGNETIVYDGNLNVDVDYIYVGNGIGFLNPEELINHQNYLPVYHRDGVYILKKLPSQ